MDQLTRRDAVYHSLDQISSAFREPSSTSAGTNTNLRRSAVASPTSLTVGLPSSIPIPGGAPPLGSPPLSPSRSLSGGPLDYLNRVGSSLAGALQNSPLNGAPDDVSPRLNPNRIRSLYTSLGPILPAQARLGPRRPSLAPPPPSPPRLPPQQAAEKSVREDADHATRPAPSLLAHQIAAIHGTQSAAQSTDSLPDYSPGSLPANSQSVMYQHSIATPTSKLELTLDSVGSKEYPVYVQDVCPVVAGKVRMRIQGDENAQELRIRVKGVATTTVLRAQHNAARTIAEEEEFWYAGCTLWNAQSDDKKAASQEYVDLPFKIPIPPMVSVSARRKAYPMPPSFILATARSYDNGGIDSASIRYYVKITLARKGLLRPNERLFAPVVYYTRASDLSFLTEARRLALIHNTSIPSPLEEPDAWQGRVEEINLKKGFFAGKKQSYKIAILLPAPLVYGKSETLPYFLRITSSEPSLLNKIESSSISVQLIQRCAVISHGAPGVQENIISDGQTVLAEDTNPNATEMTRRFKGSLQLSRAPATSFRSYNIEVSYHIVCRLMSGSYPMDGVTQVPIALVSIPPVALDEDEQDSQSIHTIAQANDSDLPPSYFDVIERDTPR